MLDEEGAEDRADRVQAAEEGRGDAVEAHAGDAGLRAGPLLNAREVEERGAHAGERAADDERDDDVALFLHAGVLRGVLVVAGGAQLIAELRALEDDVDRDRDEDRERHAERDVLVVAEDLRQAEARHDGAGARGQHLVGIGAGGLLDVREDDVHEIEADPVEHDAGDDLVDVGIGLEEAGDAAEERARRHGEEHAQPPRPVERQRRIQARADARNILTRDADVKQAHLIRKEDRQRAHDQRRGLDERGAEILHARGAGGIKEEVLQHGEDRLARAGGVDDEQDNVADEHAENDADQRGDERLHTVPLEKGCFVFHFATSLRLAPAM